MRCILPLSAHTAAGIRNNLPLNERATLVDGETKEVNTELARGGPA